jgi:hypothetical protein
VVTQVQWLIAESDDLVKMSGVGLGWFMVKRDGYPDFYSTVGYDS